MNVQLSPESVDAARLEAFAGKVMSDIGGGLACLLAFIGDQTGVYRAMRDHGRAPVESIAAKAGVDPRYLLEWLSAQAAAGYVTYHAEDETFSLTPEQALVLSAEGHPACMQGFIQQLVAQNTTHETAVDTFRTGKGRGWEDHHACCFCGTDRFFRPGYDAHLVTSWIPALDGVEARLKAGAKVADLGCGLGSSTALMARTYPNSTIHGLDFHAPSIETARERAEAEGLTNVRFHTVAAKDMANEGYDLVCIFDALHDMGDPVGAAHRIRQCLAPGGTLMLVEPLAGDTLSDNLHLLGQIFYSASTLICTPASKAQEVGLQLGAQAGEKRLTAVLKEAGFTQVRVATTTDTNMILEARA